MLSYSEGEALQRIALLKGEAELLSKLISSMTAVDKNAFERGMIALRRATTQLEGAVTRSA